MKKFIIAGLILSSLLGFYSCQKELSSENGGAGPGTGGGTASGSFKAKIDGTQWEAMTVKSATIQAGVIVIYGYNAADKKNMLIRVADSGVHVYSISDTSLTNVGAYTDSSINSFAFATNQWLDNANHGTLNITRIDAARKLVSGTFSMTVKQQLSGLSRTITDGVFTDISYATQPPPPSTTDSFRVKIDGVDFSYNLLLGISTFGMITVTAAANGGTGASVGITVPSTVVPGNYAFDLFTHVGQYNPTSSIFLSADTGHVQILEHNVTTKRIRGNFNFFAKPLINPTPTAQLTQGYFSVKYQ